MNKKTNNQQKKYNLVIQKSNTQNQNPIYRVRDPLPTNTEPLAYAHARLFSIRAIIARADVRLRED